MDVNEKKQKTDKMVIVADTHTAKPKHQIVELPSNSHKSKNKKDIEEPVVGKIIKGNVIQKKKGLSKKIKEMFIGDSATDVGSYLLYDVLIPAAKTTIYELVIGGLEMRMWGESKTMRNRLAGKVGKPIVNYGLYSMGKTIGNIRETDPSNRRPAKDIGEIVFDNKPDAIEVLLHMQTYIKEYGRCSVNVLYSLIDKTGDYTDENWGWTDLDTASVTRFRNQWVLNLPRVKVLD